MRGDRVSCRCMGHQLAACTVGQADIEYSKAFAEFQEMGDGLDGTGGGLAQKVDVEVRRHGQRHRADMGQYGGIGCHIGECEKRRAGNRAAGTQMLFIGMKPHGCRTAINCRDLEGVSELRELALHECAQLFDIH